MNKNKKWARIFIASMTIYILVSILLNKIETNNTFSVAEPIGFVILGGLLFGFLVVVCTKLHYITKEY